MKKRIYSIFSALLLAGLLVGLFYSPAAAAPQIRGSVFQTGQSSLLSFAMLGQSDSVMRGPYAVTSMRFGLPSNWSFQDGAKLQLILSASLVTDAAAVQDGQPIGASLTVTLNKVRIGTIPLTAGTNAVYEFPIQPAALTPTLSDGRELLQIFLDASTDCDTNRLHQTSVIISSTSQLTLPYIEQAPVVDLNQLPRPIFQADSVFPMNAVLVVPDQPTAQELQAALTASAGFGHLTGGKLPFSLVNTSQATEDILKSSNLIFVGKASTLALLKDVKLPVPLTNNAFSPAGSQPDDGIIQIAVSPWNSGRSVMVLSGNTDAAVVKAAQALSYGNVQTIGNSDLAIVTDVTPPSTDVEGVNLDAMATSSHTFKDLGNDVITLAGAGRNETYVDFFVQPGLVAGSGSYLDLIFNNSALLDFSQSGLTVFLNGNLIGSFRFSDQTAATTTQRIKISPSLLLPGDNQLRIQADLSAPTQCGLTDATNLWASILPESTLYLPLEQAAPTSNNLQNLNVFPYPFINIPTLANTVFVTSKNDPVAWAAASQIAYGMGSRVHGAVIDLAAAYDDALPEDLRNSRDLIVVGLPANLKIISDLKDSLPAPFDAGQNVPVVSNQQVTYRFAPGTSLGYLQLLASPWNPARTILAVVGSTNDGVKMAGNALVDPALKIRLSGNFALVNAQDVSSVDTRTGLGMGGIASNPGVITQPVVPSAATPGASLPIPSAVGRPAWILPAVGVLAFLIVGVLIFALIAGRRESRN